MQITSVIRIHAAVFTEGGPPLTQDIINEMFPVHGHPPHQCRFATRTTDPKISNTNQNMLVSVFVGCRSATVALIQFFLQFYNFYNLILIIAMTMHVDYPQSYKQGKAAHFVRKD